MLGESLPDRFGLVTDGWDHGHGEYYVAIYAIFPDKNFKRKTYLLAIQPLLHVIKKIR